MWASWSLKQQNLPTEIGVKFIFSNAIYSSSILIYEFDIRKRDNNADEESKLKLSMKWRFIALFQVGTLGKKKKKKMFFYNKILFEKIHV